MAEILRLANVNDIPQITRIYNEGIEDRIATLETCLRTQEDMIEWFNNRDEKHSVVVIEDGQGIAVGWASINVFNSRCCYSGVADISIYIQRDKRGKGFGKKLMEYLINTARDQGFHKLVLSTFKFNQQGQRLYKSAGFREVGTYINQGILEGKFIDITIMEKLLI
jgi:L-amino acid N-acyltransferase YncA